MPEIKETTYLKDLWNEEHALELGGDQDALALDQQISGERAMRVLGWRPQAPSVMEEMKRGLY